MGRHWKKCLGALLLALANGTAIGAAVDNQPTAPLRIAQTDTTSAEPADVPAKKTLDVKNTFRNICGFCHESYGRKGGKGPQLMNSERTDEYLFNRIKNGLPGRMAAWGSIFDDDQIRLIVKFIRSLKPDEDPQNP